VNIISHTQANIFTPIFYHTVHIILRIVSKLGSWYLNQKVKYWYSKNIGKVSPFPKATTTLSEVMDHYTTVTNTHGDKTLVSPYLTCSIQFKCSMYMHIIKIKAT